MENDWKKTLKTHRVADSICSICRLLVEFLSLGYYLCRISAMDAIQPGEFLGRVTEEGCSSATNRSWLSAPCCRRRLCRGCRGYRLHRMSSGYLHDLCQLYPGSLDLKTEIIIHFSCCDPFWCVWVSNVASKTNILLKISTGHFETKTDVLSHFGWKIRLPVECSANIFSTLDFSPVGTS